MTLLYPVCLKTRKTSYCYFSLPLQGEGQPGRGNFLDGSNGTLTLPLIPSLQGGEIENVIN